MAPFGGEPGVVEIEPADRRADVERRLHRIELELRARYFGAVGNDRTRDDRSEQLGAGRIRQRFEPATERVDQAVPRRLVRFLARYLVLDDVVGDIGEDLVGLGADGGYRARHDHRPGFGSALEPAFSGGGTGAVVSGARSMP